MKTPLFAASTFLLGFCVSGGAVAQPEAAAVKVEVKPSVQRFIGNVSKLDRYKYFNFHNPVTVTDSGFRERVAEELGVFPGREVGGFTWTANRTKEDPNRPGYFDHQSIKEFVLTPTHNGGEVSFRLEQFRPFNNAPYVVAGGGEEWFPEWSRKDADGNVREWTMRNYDAYADFINAMIQYEYNWLPKDKLYIEILNEPNANMGKHGMTHQDIFESHKLTAPKVKAVHPEVHVGGPADCWPAYQKNDFKIWDQMMRPFIDQCADELDFIAIHFYEHVGFNPTIGKTGDHRGFHRVAATMDLVENYQHNTKGVVKPFVISEYGATVHPRGLSGPDETYPRSEKVWDIMTAVLEKMHLFIERPDRVASTTPYIMIYSPWEGPEPYYAMYNEPAPGRFVETDLVKVYEFIKGVNGSRVVVDVDHHRIQAHAFVDGTDLWVWLVNTSQHESFPVDIETIWPVETKVFAQEVRRIKLVDGLPALVKTSRWDEDQGPMTLDPEENVIVKFTAQNWIRMIDQVYDETHYGKQTILPIQDGPVAVEVPGVADGVQQATLRVSYARPEAKVLEAMTVVVNGQTFELPEAELITDESVWSARELLLPGELIQAENTVEVSFPSAGGHLSSVVLETRQAG